MKSYCDISKSLKKGAGYLWELGGSAIPGIAPFSTFNPFYNACSNLSYDNLKKAANDSAKQFTGLSFNFLGLYINSLIDYDLADENIVVQIIILSIIFEGGQTMGYFLYNNITRLKTALAELCEKDCSIKSMFADIFRKPLAEFCVYLGAVSFMLYGVNKHQFVPGDPNYSDAKNAGIDMIPMVCGMFTGAAIEKIARDLYYYLKNDSSLSEYISINNAAESRGCCP